jgi:hypothetical protein
MTADRYQANIITKNPTDPTSSLETGAAPGVWSLEEANRYKKQGVWPTAGNVEVNVSDVFSTFLYTGNSINGPAIENGLALGQSYGSGGINIDQGKVTTGTNSGFAYGTGDFTYEAWVRPEVDDGTLNSSNMYIFDHGAGNLGGASYYNGVLRYYNGTVYDSTQAINNYEWAHIAVSRSSGYTKLFYNGTAVRGIASDTFNYAATSFVIGGYGGSNAYGWKGRMAEVRVSNIARYTSNFTPPTTGFTSDSNTILLAGQSSSLVDNGPNSIGLTATSPAAASGYGPFDAATAGDGGMVWFKNRNSTDDLHIYDTERGANNRISSNQTTAQYSGPSTYGLTSFTANGFTVGATGAVNNTGQGICAWSFKKHAKFFTCLTYTGDGTSSRQISHDLGSVPGAILVKRTDSGREWAMYHRGVDASSPENYYLALNTTAARSLQPNYWQNTAPTSTVFTVGNDTSVNASGGTYVAYIWAHNDGDGNFGPTLDQDIIKCGSYTGTGALQEIDLGFEAQWVMIKRTDSTQDWMTFDQMRGIAANPVAGSTPTGDQDARIRPNSSAAEATDTYGIDPSPSGFSVRGNNVSASGSTYIYVAIRRGPMSAPTVGTDVFAMDTGAGSTPSFEAGVTVDLALVGRNDSTDKWYFSSRITGDNYLNTASTSAQSSSPAFGGFDYQTQYYGGSLPSTYQAWMWRRAPEYFTMVPYEGDGSAARTISHNLGVAPEMIWVKKRSGAESWAVYHKLNGGTHFARLQSTDAYVANSNLWDNTDATASVFTVDTDTEVNQSGHTYMAFLFASVDGVSKVDSFVSDGSDMTIDCGFTAGARFVLIKKANAADDWFFWDTERGITTGNDSRLRLNSTAAAATGSDNIAPDNSGFIIKNNILGGSGNTFLYYAIA